MKRFYTFLIVLFILSSTQAKNFYANINSLNVLNVVFTDPTFNPVGPICAGDFLSPLPTTSLNGITGSWSPAINNSVTTTYTFTPDPGQSANPKAITIIVNAIPTTTLFCDASNMPIFLIFDWAPIVGATSYQFSYSIDGGPPLTGSTSISNHSVFGLQSNQSITFTLTSITGLSCFRPISVTCGALTNSDLETIPLISFPNPVTDVLNVSFNQPINSIEVFNMIGQLVFSGVYNSSSIQIFLSQYKSGIYIIKAMVNQNSKLIKVVKK